MPSTSPPCAFDHPPPSAQREGVGIAQSSVFNPVAFERAVADLLRACGISADSPHTSKTATRVRELWEKRLLGGYAIEPGAALGEGFEDTRQDMVLLRGIAIHGVCPHHLVPFRGIAHVAYIPGGRLHGFGRIARMVDAIGHRFTYQEWMTRDIAEVLMTAGRASGAACVIEAEQLCLLLGEDRRGDERVYTQAFSGCLQDDPALRAEFLQALNRPGFKS